MSHLRRRLGMTLIETLVVCVLLGLVTSMVLSLVAGVSAQTSSNQDEKDNLDQAQKAIARLQLELGNSSENYISVGNNTGSLVFPVADTTAQPNLDTNSTSGALIWHRWVAWSYDSTNGQLWRSELPLATPQSNPGSAPPQSAFVTRQVVVSNVLACTLTPDTVNKLVGLNLQVGSAQHSVTLTSKVGPRN